MSRESAVAPSALLRIIFNCFGFGGGRVKDARRKRLDPMAYEKARTGVRFCKIVGCSACAVPSHLVGGSYLFVIKPLPTLP
jgi:hypothetical protein